MSKPFLTLPRLGPRALGVHIGRTVATAEGRVDAAAGRLCAHGTSALLVIGT